MDNNKYKQICINCGKEFSNGFQTLCDHCNSLIDIEYEISKVNIKNDSNILIKYFDLLPIKKKENIIWNGCGNTPCFRAENLGKVLGNDNIYLKDETKNPTWTTKDRMASVVLSYFKELGIKKLVVSSTGNSSTSLAHTVNMFPFFELYVFTGSEFANRLNFDASPNVRIISLDGASFYESSVEAEKFAKKNGILYDSGFFNPARREGLKLAFLEACDQIKKSPDWYFQAVSSAMGVYGTYKAAEQYVQMGRINKIPKLCCVQQDSCAPMVHAWNEKSPYIKKNHIVNNPTGLAKAILRGNPSKSYPYIYNIVDKSGGSIEKVTQKEILFAKELVLKTENIDICSTSACTIAALKNLIDRNIISRTEVVVINLTGRDRKPNSLQNSSPYIYKIKESMWRKKDFWLNFHI